MRKIQNKWIRAAIPALLLHCSIGTVYCWSLVSESIAEYIGSSKGAVEWAFSIAIFFLGMSAAFLGNVVERDIHLSSLISTICFAVGMVGTGFFISQKSLIGIFICYGVIMGIGLGTGYLSPVKTLMLWFSDQKGLATGLAVAGFGLAKVIASPVMEFLQAKVGIVGMFYILAAVYFVLMFAGHLLLAKPEGWVESQEKTKGVSVLDIFKNRTFIGIWLMFYINITCGLVLISQEKSIVKALGMAGMVGLISSLTAVFNAGGRVGFSAWADKLKDRNTVYKAIFILSIVFNGLVIATKGIVNGYTLIVIPLLFVINAGYGGGFSNVPTLLSDHFGMKSISRIHGLVLSAWAFAGLTGNQLAVWIVNRVGSFVDDGHGNMVNPVGYQTVLIVTCVLYVIALIISCTLVSKKKEVEKV
ncbi:MAG: MFS transporter [Clostridia bacterium]|nr:OFA family MFS transporter [Lachnospiraceae bacterium]NCC00612.1 MFS transporter [Clostridia bacterium]NCD02040.1 MFS transporter [Clostridia bacterium]